MHRRLCHFTVSIMRSAYGITTIGHLQIKPLHLERFLPFSKYLIKYVVSEGGARQERNIRHTKNISVQLSRNTVSCLTIYAKTENFHRLRAIAALCAATLLAKLILPGDLSSMFVNGNRKRNDRISHTAKLAPNAFRNFAYIIYIYDIHVQKKACGSLEAQTTRLTECKLITNTNQHHITTSIAYTRVQRIIIFITLHLSFLFPHQPSPYPYSTLIRVVVELNNNSVNRCMSTTQQHPKWIYLSKLYFVCSFTAYTI